MQKIRKKQILAVTEEALNKAREVAQKRRATAKHFRRASRSQQGDRRYFENVADLAESNLAELLTFKKEIEATDEVKNETVKSVSFVEIQYPDGVCFSFYFTNRSIRLPGLQILTPHSPLGQAIEGKKEGEKFVYEVERDNQHISHTGRIKKIE
ncbi:MAG: hypothetical protein JW991_05025 [Candidatus Pacebacteria bacterium]|nr:hypothetical protein [Candidatus Paceibacterota bacterium]